MYIYKYIHLHINTYIFIYIYINVYICNTSQIQSMCYLIVYVIHIMFMLSTYDDQKPGLYNGLLVNTFGGSQNLYTGFWLQRCSAPLIPLLFRDRL